MSVDHASGVAISKTDPIFLHARAGMTVIVEDGNNLRMADVDTGVINWFNADPVTRTARFQGSDVNADFVSNDVLEA